MATTDKTSITADTSAITDGQTIDAADVTTAITDLLDAIKAGRVGVSDNDTHVGGLLDKLAATSPVTLTETGDGGDETLTVALTAAMTALASFLNGSGQVGLSGIDTGAALVDTPLVADGAGAVTTGSPGAANPNDITITAGEALAVRDFVSVDPSDGKAYKWDATPSAGNAGGFLLRGVVTSTTIAQDATGTMRVDGQVSGFSGLTVGKWVYVNPATAGN
jgi:hypothetical protein